MPIQPDVVKRDMSRRGVAPGQDLTQQTVGNQQNSDHNVHAMESRDQEKRGAINSTLIEPEAFMMKVGPLINLKSHEDQPQKQRRDQPKNAGFSFFDRILRPVIGEAAAHKEKGGDKGFLPWQLRITFAWGPGMARLPGKSIFRPPKNKVAAEQSGKKHGLGCKENDHSKLAGGGGSFGVASFVTVGVVGKNSGAHLGKIKK